MIITVVDGYDHYVILSVDCVNAQRSKSMAKFDDVVMMFHLTIIVTVFPYWYLIKTI
jgi:heme/copper-type cytochrome/quinol oxidase subunit 4